MTAQELIDKYELVRRGDKVGTHKKGVTRAQMEADVWPRKDEILAYMKAQEQAKAKEAADRLARKEATFNAIPGVPELRTAREDNTKWQQELTRMVESGSGTMRPGFTHHSDEELHALEAQYPQAVKALEIRYRAQVTHNYEMSRIYNKAYDAIQDGADVDETYATMKAELSALSDKHLWD